MLTDNPNLEQLWMPVALSATAIFCLVLSDYRNWRPGRYLFKPVAAAAFLWLALLAGPPASSYGSWLVAGLLCCMAGDLLLMPDSDRFFLAGLFAFLCGHLLYAMAFLQLPGNLTGLSLSVAPALILMIGAMRWFGPHLPDGMRIPVALYTLVITGMLLCAGLSLGHAAAFFIISGAWGFAISDLAVARRQFVAPGPGSGLWGTPLYFSSQMLLAYSVHLG